MLNGLVMAAVLLVAKDAPKPVFPDGLLGRWTQDMSYCGDDDTRGIQIDSDKIAFDKMTGVPSSIADNGRGVITAEVRYSGEDRTWTEINTFALSKDLSKVRIHVFGRALDLRRCPVILDLAL